MTHFASDCDLLGQASLARQPPPCGPSGQSGSVCVPFQTLSGGRDMKHDHCCGTAAKVGLISSGSATHDALGETGKMSRLQSSAQALWPALTITSEYSQRWSRICCPFCGRNSSTCTQAHTALSSNQGCPAAGGCRQLQGCKQASAHPPALMVQSKSWGVVDPLQGRHSLKAWLYERQPKSF